MKGAEESAVILQVVLVLAMVLAWGPSWPIIEAGVLTRVVLEANKAVCCWAPHRRLLLQLFG